MPTILKKIGIIVLCLSPNLLIAAAPSCSNPQIPISNSDLIDNQNGTISDLTTGLIWKKCSEGQQWNQANNSCEGTATRYNWQQALKRAEGEALGQSDWRLPNIKELASIIELSCINPAINTDIFPNTASGLYWSSSPYAGDSAAGAWYIPFYNGGYDGVYSKNNKGFVRLVRSGQ